MNILYYRTALVVVFLMGLVIVASLIGMGSVATETGGEITSITSPQTIEPNDTFEITVNTTDSAGTIVKVNPERGSVDLSSKTNHKVVDNQIRFLDPAASSSGYVVEVDYSGGTTGDNINISSWVNAEQRPDADDSLDRAVVISKQREVQIVDAKLSPSTVNTGSSSRHKLSFDVNNVSADDAQDNFSVKIPEGIIIEQISDTADLNGTDTRVPIDEKDGLIKFTVNPNSSSVARDYNISINMSLSANKSYSDQVE